MSRTSRWLLWIGCGILVVVLAAGIAIAILLHRAEPMLRASLIDTLQKRFHSKVELDDLHVSIVDGFQVEGRGLRIWLPVEAQESLEAAAAAPVDDGKPHAGKKGNSPTDSVATITPAELQEWKTEPWIIVSKMHFHASWHILPGKPIVVSGVYVEGVRVLLPPKADRPHLSLSGKSEATDTDVAPASDGQDQNVGGSQPQTTAEANSGSGSKLFKMPEVEVRRIECQDALLVIERTQQPGKPPIPLMVLRSA